MSVCVCMSIITILAERIYNFYAIFAKCAYLNWLLGPIEIGYYGSKVKVAVVQFPFSSYLSVNIPTMNPSCCEPDQCE